MLETKYSVYAKINEGLVYKFISTCFETPEKEDIFVKEGVGDEFVHVSYYSVYDENGCHNYKVVNEKIVETSLEEKQNELKDKQVNSEPTEMQILQNENKLLKAQIDALNATTEFHEELIAEMAMMLYA